MKKITKLCAMSISFLVLTQSNSLEKINNDNLSHNENALRIVQNPRASIWDKIRAAKELKNIPEFFRQIAQGYLSLAQNQNVCAQFRLIAAKELKNMPEFSQQAAQAYLSILLDPSVENDWRSNAGLILKNMPEFDQQTAQTYLSIAQDSAVGIILRLRAVKILKDMSEFSQKAANILFSIAQDPEIDICERLDATKIILYSQLPGKEGVIGLVKDIFQSCLLRGSNLGLPREDLLILFYVCFYPGRIFLNRETGKNISWSMIISTLNDIIVNGGVLDCFCDYWLEDGNFFAIRSRRVLKILQWWDFFKYESADT